MGAFLSSLNTCVCWRRRTRGEEERRGEEEERRRGIENKRRRGREQEGRRRRGQGEGSEQKVGARGRSGSLVMFLIDHVLDPDLLLHSDA